MTEKKKRTKKSSQEEPNCEAHEIAWDKGKAFDTVDISHIDDMKNYDKKPNGKNDTGRPEKYSLEWCKEELSTIWRNLTDPDAGHLPDKEVKRWKGFLFIGEICMHRGYAPQRWSEWLHDHGHDGEFSETYKKIEAFLEIRLVKAGLGRTAERSVTIFVLKNKYGYKDKVDITSGDKPIHEQPDFSQFTDEELDQYLRLQDKMMKKK